MFTLVQTPINIDTVELATPFDWVTVVTQLGAAGITAVVTWLLARKRNAQDLQAVKDAARTAKGRHEAELQHQRELHSEQVESFIENEQRGRQAAILREAADALSSISVRAKMGQLSIDDSVRLRQLALKVRPDFDGMDDAFAYHSAAVLESFADEIDRLRPDQFPRPADAPDTDIPRILLSEHTKKLAFYMVRWFDPRLALGCTQAIERFSLSGSFDHPERGEKRPSDHT